MAVTVYDPARTLANAVPVRRGVAQTTKKEKKKPDPYAKFSKNIGTNTDPDRKADPYAQYSEGTIYDPRLQQQQQQPDDSQAWWKSGLGAILDNPVTSAILQPLDLLAVPGRLITSGFKEQLDLIQGEGYSFADLYNQTNPLHWLHGENSESNIGWGKILEEETGGTGNVWADRAIGFLGDVATDPLTYASFGLGPAIGKGARATQLAKLATKSDEVTRTVKALETAQNAPAALKALGYADDAAPVVSAGRRATSTLDELNDARALRRALGTEADRSRMGVRGIGLANEAQAEAMGLGSHGLRLRNPLTGNEFTGPIPGTEGAGRAINRAVGAGRERVKRIPGVKPVLNTRMPKGYGDQDLAPAYRRIIGTGNQGMGFDKALGQIALNNAMRRTARFGAVTADELDRLAVRLEGYGPDDFVEMEAAGLAGETNELIEFGQLVLRAAADVGGDIPEIASGRYPMPHTLTRDFRDRLNAAIEAGDPMAEVFKREADVKTEDLLKESGHLSRRKFNPGDEVEIAPGYGFTVETGTARELNEKFANIFPDFTGKIYEEDPIVAYRNALEALRRDVARRSAAKQGLNMPGQPVIDLGSKPASFDPMAKQWEQAGDEFDPYNWKPTDETYYTRRQRQPGEPEVPEGWATRPADGATTERNKNIVREQKELVNTNRHAESVREGDLGERVISDIDEGFVQPIQTARGEADALGSAGRAGRDEALTDAKAIAKAKAETSKELAETRREIRRLQDRKRRLGKTADDRVARATTQTAADFDEEIATLERQARELDAYSKQYDDAQAVLDNAAAAQKEFRDAQAALTKAQETARKKVSRKVAQNKKVLEGAFRRVAEGRALRRQHTQEMSAWQEAVKDFNSIPPQKSIDELMELNPGASKGAILKAKMDDTARYNAQKAEASAKVDELHELTHGRARTRALEELNESEQVVRRAEEAQRALTRDDGVVRAERRVRNAKRQAFELDQAEVEAAQQLIADNTEKIARLAESRASLPGQLTSARRRKPLAVANAGRKAKGDLRKETEALGGEIAEQQAQREALKVQAEELDVQLTDAQNRYLTHLREIEEGRSTVAELSEVLNSGKRARALAAGKKGTNPTIKQMQGAIEDTKKIAAAAESLPDGPTKTALRQAQAQMEVDTEDLADLAAAQMSTRQAEKVIKDARNGKLPKIIDVVMNSHVASMAKSDPESTLRMAPEMAQAFQRVRNIQQEPGAFGRTLLAYTNFFKTYATATPGFHVRNGLSAIFMNTVVGVRMKTQLEGLNLWRAYANSESPEKFLIALRKSDPMKADALDVAFASGSGGRFFDSGIAEANAGAGKAKQKIYSNKITTTSQRIGQDWVEGPVRTGLALDQIQKGGTTQDALDMVTAVHFDYSQVSDFDARAKQLVPFWTFMSRNLPTQVSLMYTKPRVYSYYNHFLNNFGQDIDPLTPDYWLDQGVINTPFDWFGDDVYVSPDLAHSRLDDDVEMLKGLTQADPSKLLSSFNPFFTAPIEYATGKDFFTGYETPEDEMRDIGPLEIPAALLGLFTGQTEDGQVNARLAQAFQSTIPDLDRAGRLAPAATGDDRRGSAAEGRARYLGLPVRVLTEQRKESESRRQTREAREDREGAA